MKEIGSDFWKAELKISDIRFLLSGRTALEYIIRDIIFTRKINSVLMPSYCCYTMLEPFIRHGVDVRFYDVFFDGKCLCIKMPKPKEYEAVFLIKYFGYQRTYELDTEELKRMKNIIIEDRTHSWLNKIEQIYDYSFISYRKWTGVGSIALAEKREGKFSIPLPKRINNQYEDLKNRAEFLKTEYIEKEKGEKEKFLELYKKSEESLKEYVDCIPSYKSMYKLCNLDLEKIVNARRQNALWLLQEIKNISGIIPIFEKIEASDVPLFVPVLIEPNKRDKIRKYLISKDIYCPIHWPLSQFHKLEEKNKLIYEMELSLLCDQRYTIDDMKKIVNALKNI